MKKRFLVIFPLLCHLTVTHASVIDQASIHSLHHAIKERQITCVQLAEQYFARIKKYNLSATKQAPLNAFTEINTNLFEQAKKLDAEFNQTKQLTGPLHCIPIVLKDSIDTYDATTSAGTLALLGNQPTRDAFLVAQLRKAGALIVGKTAMDELANGMFGTSSRSGRVGNAYDTNNNPGGSSGGSAVAVSAGFAVIGIGTDNSGSVRIPAAFHGLVGLRPSTGLISQQGIFPAGNLDGIAGPITRNVEDLAIVLDTLAKADHADKKTLNIPRVKTSYTTFLNKNGLQNKRIGILHRVGKADTFKSMPSHVIQAFLQTEKIMQQNGAILIDNIELPHFDNDRSGNLAGMRQDVDAYLASYPAVRKNFKDICESGRAPVMGSPKQCVQFIHSMPAKYQQKYKKALAIFNKNKMYVEKVMREKNLDALLLPLNRKGEATYDAYSINTWLAPISSNAGLPAITINLGYAGEKHMPIGAELIGKPYDEGTLIEIIYAYDQIASEKIPPILPEENLALEKLDIPAFNNLLREIGYASYQEVLKNQSAKHLTAKEFQELVRKKKN